MGYYMPIAGTQQQMAEEGRALLTPSEREILTGEREVSDNYEYKVRSLVRVRIRKKFGRDVDILRDHFPEVYEMLKEEVCGGSDSDDIETDGGRETSLEPSIESERKLNELLEGDYPRGGRNASGD